MRHVILLLVVLLSLAPFASAQWENKGASDAPSSLDEMKWVVEEASSTAKKLETIKKEIDDVNRRGEASATRMKAHNALWPNGCEYPPDNPHFCDAWVQEAAEQNSAHRSLLQQFQVLSINQGMAKTHLSVMLARIRLAPFFDGLTDWEFRVILCASPAIHTLESSHRCLVDAWENHP